MQQEYEMSEDQLTKILEACKPVTYIVIGGVPPHSPQENANDAWNSLGREMGFKPATVEPVLGKGDRFFTAEPIEVE